MLCHFFSTLCSKHMQGHKPGIGESDMQAQWDPLISGIEFVQRGPVTPAVRTRIQEQLLSWIQSSRDALPSAAMWQPGKEIDPKSSFIPFLITSFFPCPLANLRSKMTVLENFHDFLPLFLILPHCTSSSIGKHLCQKYVIRFMCLASSGEELVP